MRIDTGSMRSASTGWSTSSCASVQTPKPVQGNLDPLVLLAGGAALDRAVDE